MPMMYPFRQSAGLELVIIATIPTMKAASVQSHVASAAQTSIVSAIITAHALFCEHQNVSIVAAWGMKVAIALCLAVSANPHSTRVGII